MTAHDVSNLNHDWFRSDNLCAVTDRAYRRIANHGRSVYTFTDRVFSRIYFFTSGPMSVSSFSVGISELLVLFQTIFPVVSIRK